MDITMLEYFRAVAEHEHLTRAAESLHITQPALSVALKRLEQEVGTPLFDRCGRNIKLNTSGEIYLRHVNVVLAELQDAAREILEQQDFRNSTLVLGLSSFLATSDAIRSFAVAYPSLFIKQKQIMPGGIADELKKGKVELVITSLRDESDSLESHLLTTFNIVLAVPKSHRFAERESIDLFEVQDDYFVFLPEGHADRIFIDAALKEIGFKHKVRFEHFQSQMLNTVASGVGLALVSEEPERNAPYTGSVSFLRITNPIRPRTTWLQWNRERPMSRNAKLCQEFLIDYYNQLNQRRISADLLKRDASMQAPPAESPL